MYLKSLKACKLSIGKYPAFIYDATGGGGEVISVKIHKNTKYIKFSPQKFKIPPLNWKTTKFLSIPLPPGIRIEMNMDKLEGIINNVSGEINLEFEARFRLQIFSVFKFPDLFIKSLLNTGKIRTKNFRSQGKRLLNNGETKLVGVATISKTNNLILDKFLFLPTEALAELNCELT